MTDLTLAHDDSLIKEHIQNLATLNQCVKDLRADMAEVKNKLDSNRYLLLLAIAAVIVDMANQKLHII